MASDLIEAMSRGLTGRGHVEASQPLGALLGHLAQLAGSGKAAAAALGVSSTTFYRWRGGKQNPKNAGAIKSALVRGIRRASLPAAKEKAIKNKSQRMVVKGTVAVNTPKASGGSDTRTRTLNIGDHVSARKMGNVVNAWLAGDDDKADRLLDKAIASDYAEGMDIESVDSVAFVS